jgi:hypothetical protein
MLDWDGRKFPSDKPKFMIQRPDVLEALRTGDRTFSESEVYIRDCFDRLFWYFERINHELAVGMISTAHISFPIKYIVSLLIYEEEVFKKYLVTFRCEGALSLIETFKQLGAEPLKPPYQALNTGRRLPFFGRQHLAGGGGAHIRNEPEQESRSTIPQS